MKIKSNFFFLSFLITAGLIFTSCSSDDDSQGETGEDTRVLNVEKADGTLFTDGEVVTFSEYGGNGSRPEDVQLKYFLKNVSNENIKVKIEVAEIRGTDGSLFTFCVQPLCIFNVTEGETYPANGTVIAPGQYNSQDDYFINNDPGNQDTSSIEYDMRFYVEDEDGNQSNDLTITYKYLPN